MVVFDWCNHSFFAHIIIVIIINKDNYRQQNRKCKLCRDRDETISHIIGECNEQVQNENKTRHDTVGKFTHWELYKKLQFDHTTKWYTHKPESVRENKLQKILRDFQIQTDHPIIFRRPDLVTSNKKKNLTYSERWRSSEIKKKTKIEKYLDLAQERRNL